MVMQRASVRFFLLAMFSAIALSACANGFSNPAGADRERLLLGSNEGRVIITLRTPQQCFATTDLVIQREGAITGGWQLQFGNPFIGSDYPGHYGTLNVLRVRAGNHEVFAKGGGTVEADFTIAPGETLYLGEIELTETCMGGRVRINDEYERDFQLLQQRNPELAQQPITRRILTWRPEN